jgi:enoyl-CoA hydratase
MPCPRQCFPKSPAPSRNFSAGFDLRTFQRGPDAAREMVHAGARLIERFLTFPQPILTVCTGHAYPMGAFLMLSADARLGVQGPWRIGMNETAIGITVPMFAVELARHRLAPQAFANINAATMYSPDEAVRVGYLDRICAPEELAASAEQEARRLRALDAPSFRATKSRVNRAVLDSVTAAIDLEIGRLATAS